MLVTKNKSRLLFTVVAILGLATSVPCLFAQQPGAPRGVTVKGQPLNDERTFEKTSTLDDVRAIPVPAASNGDMSDGMGWGSRMGGEGMGMGMGDPLPPDARQLAMRQVNELRSQLASPKADRADVENKLRAALSEYFMADLQHRVRELDAVKAKVQQMETRLQKRLDLKNEAIDLQLKRMQHEADGLEFVVPNEPGSLDGPRGGMSGGYPGGSGGLLGAGVEDSRALEGPKSVLGRLGSENSEVPVKLPATNR